MNFIKIFMSLKYIICFICSFICYTTKNNAQSPANHSLTLNKLATRWDEAMPMGNGMIGALIWQKDGNLRMSLDRADLWDERKAFDLDAHNFEWVKQQIEKKNYAAVQAWGDVPYEASPYPTKLPAAALEFNMTGWGKVVENTLDIQRGVNTIRFDSGLRLTTFVHATEPFGYFEITGEGAAAHLPILLPHQYGKKDEQLVKKSSVEGLSLSRLGYKQGEVKQQDSALLYHQPTYDRQYYEVLVKWHRVEKNKVLGMWTVSNNRTATLPELSKEKEMQYLIDGHLTWWQDFWHQSALALPDKQLEKQYYLEMYKLGATARKGAPAITLQAVWTADNGGLPPWKGDFHNDLNTQLSYWPAYTGNRMREAETFTDWLWQIRKENLAYTKQYFGVAGLNVPGVVTLTGKPMGGWVQYSLSPTVSAWTAQHFYWQWKYGMDDKFLKERAYPYLTEVATYLKNITQTREGKRYLPLSSSPEYHDNSVDAWYKDWTNYDLSLAKFVFKAAAEISRANGKEMEEKTWLQVLAQLPAYAENNTGFLVAPGEPMGESHRHFSPYMAIYPLALLDVNKANDSSLMKASLRHMENLGTRAWVGYSFTWIACMYARAKEADKAVLNLKKFEENFCSINSFHLNGDQKGGQYSGFTYRPFTLEGNFAFAQGIHELLLQSKFDYVEVFPAIPVDWKNVSFQNLRAAGGFLISAEKKNGTYQYVKVKAEKAGLIRLKAPTGLEVVNAKNVKRANGLWEIKLKAGEHMTLRNIKI